jgi:hypothetical protein
MHKFLIERVYSEVSLVELRFLAQTNHVQCENFVYVNEEEIKHFSDLLGEFTRTLYEIEWIAGTHKYSSQKVKISMKDKCGHVWFDVMSINNRQKTDEDIFYCSFRLLFELGQLENLRKGLSRLLLTDHSTVFIENYSI